MHLCVMRFFYVSPFLCSFCLCSALNILFLLFIYGFLSKFEGSKNCFRDSRFLIDFWCRYEYVLLQNRMSKAISNFIEKRATQFFTSNKGGTFYDFGMVINFMCIIGYFNVIRD